MLNGASKKCCCARPLLSGKPDAFFESPTLDIPAQGQRSQRHRGVVSSNWPKEEKVDTFDKLTLCLLMQKHAIFFPEHFTVKALKCVTQQREVA